MAKKRPTTAQQPAAPANPSPETAPTRSAGDERPPCPSCGGASVDRLYSHTDAGQRWTRYQCQDCTRVFTQKTALEPAA